MILSAVGIGLGIEVFAELAFEEVIAVEGVFVGNVMPDDALFDEMALASIVGSTGGVGCALGMVVESILEVSKLFPCAGIDGLLGRRELPGAALVVRGVKGI